MEPTPGPTTALDFNHALLQSRDQARAQWADGLAQFQAQMLAIHEPSLAEVVLAAAPAFASPAARAARLPVATKSRSAAP